jgi:DNA-binding helix-hairpin-helix protein with protein kinase domain
MFRDEHGNRIVLGERVGNPGGEGTTHAVSGRSEVVAKIYHSNRLPDRQQCEKLSLQASAQLISVRKIAAWPQKLLFDDKGKTVGFLMPRITGKSIHLLYRPVDRNLHFPNATWQSLIDVARNVAAAFHCLHQHAVIMGDVNETNVLVTAETGEVRFIDCDSFQVQGANGQVFPCSVLTSGWAPPELIEAPSLVSKRTIQHDLFGLAVMIFHLLFMGRHPFAGVPPNHLLENSPSLEDLIKQAIFPYSRNGRGSFKPPPNFLTLQALPGTVANLFDRAFLTRSRPSADEWCRELERIETKKCQWGHVFYKGLTECPWCAIWNHGGGNFFVVLTSGNGSGLSLTEVEKLLSAVESATFPDTTNFGAYYGQSAHRYHLEPLEKKAPFTFTIPAISLLNVPTLQPTPFPKIRKQRMWFYGGFAVLLLSLVLPVMLRATPGAPVLIFLFGICWALALIGPGPDNPAYSIEIERRENAVRGVTASIESLMENLRQLSTRSLAEFGDEKRKSLKRVGSLFDQDKRDFDAQLSLVRQEIRNLRDETKALNQMGDLLRRQRAEEAQLEAHLRNARIPNHGIPHIGPVRYKTLDSYGIFTAWDVAHMTGVPGLGQGAAELRRWQRRVEGRFHFNPSAPLPSAAEQEVRKTVQSKEQEKLRAYQKLSAQWKTLQRSADLDRIREVTHEAVAEEARKLDSLILRARADYEDIRRKLDEKVCRYAQAIADAKACPH